MSTVRTVLGALLCLAIISATVVLVVKVVPTSYYAPLAYCAVIAAAVVSFLANLSQFSGIDIARVLGRGVSTSSDFP